MIRKSPEGRVFDNFYNAMNGQFLQLSANEWLYVFGEFRARENGHRLLVLRLRFG